MGATAKIVVGAWVFWAGAGVSLAQPPPSPEPTGGPVQPPKFQEAPVSAETVKKVKQSLTEDPFDHEGGATAQATKADAAPASTAEPDTGTAAPAARAPRDSGTPSAGVPAPARAPSTPPPASTAEPTPVPPPAASPSAAAPGVKPADSPPAAPPAPTGTPPAENRTPPPRTDARSTGAQLAPVSPSQYEDVRPAEPGVASRAPEPARYDAGPGFGLQVGGGIMSFGSSQMRSVTGTGGYWDARVVLGLRSFLALELAYVGTANPVLPPAVETSGTLIGHGAEGALRLNIPLISRDGAFVLPYGIAGLGWQRYRIANGQGTGAVLALGDDVLTVPVGGGVSIGYRHLYFDTRFTYRITQYEDMLPGNTEGTRQLRHWSFGGNVGYVF